MYILTFDDIVLVVFAASQLLTILRGVSWFIFLVVVLTTSHWTDWCRCSYCVQSNNTFENASALLLDCDLLAGSDLLE
jgi:hypothetical protein